MPVIEISSLTHPGVEIFSTLTEAQLRNRLEPDKGLFIAESPKVIKVALGMLATSLWPFCVSTSTSMGMLLKSLSVVAIYPSTQAVGNCLPS